MAVRDRDRVREMLERRKIFMSNLQCLNRVPYNDTLFISNCLDTHASLSLACSAPRTDGFVARQRCSLSSLTSSSFVNGLVQSLFELFDHSPRLSRPFAIACHRRSPGPTAWPHGSSVKQILDLHSVSFVSTSKDFDTQVKLRRPTTKAKPVFVRLTLTTTRIGRTTCMLPHHWQTMDSHRSLLWIVRIDFDITERAISLNSLTCLQSLEYVEDWGLRLCRKQINRINVA